MSNLSRGYRNFIHTCSPINGVPAELEPVNGPAPVQVVEGVVLGTDPDVGSAVDTASVVISAKVVTTTKRTKLG